MKPPQISIITVCLNAVEFIDQAIASVLGQTYPELEYIVIDGGSTDGTVEVISRHASRLAYWHSRPDRGLAHAFNLGLAQAHGQWVLFLNADDLLLAPTVLEEMAPHLMRNSEADVVFGNMISLTRDREPQPVPLCKIGGHAWRWAEFRRGNMIPHQAAFTRREFFDRVGPFDEAYRLAMDYEHYLRAGAGLQARFVPVAVVGMRAGGRCVNSILDTLREFRRAQVKNRALTPGQAEVNFLLRATRLYAGVLAHLVLDPLAGKIRWAGRN
jgi:glycosyltransferase involved in cell wall biosynthesis